MNQLCQTGLGVNSRPSIPEEKKPPTNQQSPHPQPGRCLQGNSSNRAQGPRQEKRRGLPPAGQGLTPSCGPAALGGGRGQGRRSGAEEAASQRGSGLLRPPSSPRPVCRGKVCEGGTRRGGCCRREPGASSGLPERAWDSEPGRGQLPEHPPSARSPRCPRCPCPGSRQGQLPAEPSGSGRLASPREGEHGAPLGAAGSCRALPMTNAKDPKRAMDSSPATSSPAGPVTFSQVFGQQCQLMEAAVESLHSLNDQISHFIVNKSKTLDEDEDAFLPSEKESLKSAMMLMRHLLMDAQALGVQRCGLQPRALCCTARVPGCGRLLPFEGSSHLPQSFLDDKTSILQERVDASSPILVPDPEIWAVPSPPRWPSLAGAVTRRLWCWLWLEAVVVQHPAGPFYLPSAPTI
ncbi:kazrin isoform X3 [Cygnus olor]|uniref:kazrin isoform X3 n=1 Tax=Cygnus olor TaxID=8869 RepID=UPI001ADE40F3|nr:kazrin isoform X3 [Cygnus olor]